MFFAGLLVLRGPCDGDQKGLIAQVLTVCVVLLPELDWSFSGSSLRSMCGLKRNQ